MSEKTKKRLVSKREYLRAVSKKGSLLLSSWVLFGLSAFYCAAALVVLLFVLVGSLLVATGRHPGAWARGWDDANALFAFLIALLGGGLARAMYRTAQKSKEEADQIHIDVAPMTRANIQAASISESLVRASAASPSHQEVELLRGVVTPNQQTPPEELLRSAAQSISSQPESQTTGGRS